MAVSADTWAQRNAFDGDNHMPAIVPLVRALARGRKRRNIRRLRSEVERALKAAQSQLKNAAQRIGRIESSIRRSQDIEQLSRLNKQVLELRKKLRKINADLASISQAIAPDLAKAAMLAVIDEDEKAANIHLLIQQKQQQLIANQAVQQLANQTISQTKFRIEDDYQAALNHYANVTSKSLVETLLHRSQQIARHVDEILIKGDQKVLRLAKKRAEPTAAFLRQTYSGGKDYRANKSRRVADVAMLTISKNSDHIKKRGKGQWPSVRFGRLSFNYYSTVGVKSKFRRDPFRVPVGTPRDARPNFTRHLKTAGDKLIAKQDGTEHAARMTWSLRGNQARSVIELAKATSKRFPSVRNSNTFRNLRTHWASGGRTKAGKQKYSVYERLLPKSQKEPGVGKGLRVATAKVSGTAMSPVMIRTQYGSTAAQVLPSLTRRAMRRDLHDMRQHFSDSVKRNSKLKVTGGRIKRKKIR